METLFEYQFSTLLELLQAQAQIWVGAFIFDTLRYLIGVSSVTLVLTVLLASWSEKRRIQNRKASAADRYREVGYSLLTTAVYATVALFTVAAVENGWTQKYSELSEFGWAYALFSFAALFVLHDTYFYWVHRTMHHQKLFRIFHRIHHLSRTPTSWAAYSFAPGEAVVMALFMPAALMLMPLHPVVIIGYLSCMIIRNAMGHSGIEFHHHKWVDSIFDIFTTTTHHDLHHQKFSSNYALYFTWWDRWMGTENPAYKATFRAIVDQANQSDLLPHQAPNPISQEV